MLHPRALQSFATSTTGTRLNLNDRYSKPEGVGTKRWEVLRRDIKARAKVNRKARNLNASTWKAGDEQVNKVQSVWDKINDVEVDTDGTVISNYILKEKWTENS